MLEHASSVKASGLRTTQTQMTEVLIFTFSVLTLGPLKLGLTERHRWINSIAVSQGAEPVFDVVVEC